MAQRNLVSWTAMISAFSQNSEYSNAISTFCSMWVSGESANEFAFSSVVQACSFLKMVDVGRQVHCLALKVGLSYEMFVGERSKRRSLSVKKPITKAQSVANRTRSKVASGITTTKPKDPVIINIEGLQSVANRTRSKVKYVEEIYSFYKLLETERCLRNYMDSQPDINARMRATLLDWLIQAHNKYKLMPETLYLTINIVDRFLSVTTVARTELRLVGISALLISSKYEDIRPPLVNDMITISDSAYSREQILAMEKAILSRLVWYTKASLPSDNEMENMVFFFTELGLMDYSVTIRNNPSKLAASAVYAARCTLNKTPAWTETLKHYTGCGEDQLRDCAKSLVSFHARASENKFNAVYKKYVNPDRSAVSLHPPATSLLAVNHHK
ncbi:Cyclin A/B/D/E [Artemisia annua]|uniref:Cyclin A/B/D/E n=1 Tax=Artemisia annua TaxID=35608 RepID=A0A2U1KHV2_ARTAN|nr:Cyclin A/B/D/E [Artemisia annua]